MSKPFHVRAYEFFTQGHWEIGIIEQEHSYFSLGFEIFTDGAPGWHFDKTGFDIYLGPWLFHCYWVDNN